MNNFSTEIYQEIINDLNSKKYSPETFALERKHVCNNGVPLIYSVTLNGRLRRLSIPLDEKIPENSFPRWKGITLGIISGSDYFPEKKPFLMMGQRLENEDVIFETLTEDIRTRIEALPSNTGAAKTTQNVLEEWKRFFQNNKAIVLSPEAEQGLFGELLFLKKLILNFGIEMIDTWNGPDKSVHDFYLNNNAVEVKTTSGQEPYKVHINNLHQLDDSEIKKNLYLKAYAFRKDTGGKKLPDLVKEVRQIFNDDSWRLKKLNDMLLKAGYLDASASFYTKGYTVCDEYTFKIKEGFPRITKKDISIGLSKVEYDLELHACRSFAVSETDLLRELGEKKDGK